MWNCQQRGNTVYLHKSDGKPCGAEIHGTSGKSYTVGNARYSDFAEDKKVIPTEPYIAELLDKELKNGSVRFASSGCWHFFVFRNSVEKLCVSWALPFNKHVRVWACKIRKPHTHVFVPTSHKAFLRNYWNTKELAANICHSPTIRFFRSITRKTFHF